jgi:transcriptional regulator with XRE-family HTH domain
MSAAELVRAMDEAGLAISELATLCGVDRSTVWRWRTGATEVPTYAVTILTLTKTLNDLSSITLETP